MSPGDSVVPTLLATQTPISKTNLNLSLTPNNTLVGETLSTQAGKTTPQTINPIDLADNVLTAKAIGNEKDKKEKKEKNKIKNQFARAKLADIFGTPDILRINAGGAWYTDRSGKTWAADTNYIDGKTISTLANVQQTDDAQLYQSGRRGQDFAYQIPVENGKYQVNLSFVEDPYVNAGKQRVFDVMAEDQVAIDDLDIWSEVGTNRVLNKSLEVQVKDNFLDLDFLSSIGEAKVEAIEVFSLKKKDLNNKDQAVKTKNEKDNKNASTTVAIANALQPLAITGADTMAIAAVAPTAMAVSAPSTLINVGGGQYTDTTGRVWSADQYFANGAAASTSAGISGTSDSTLYQSERYGKSLDYSIPVASSGTYRVNLGFSEIFWDAPGKRVFDVSAEGQLKIDDLDIWSQAGLNTALNKSFDVAVTDGVLNLDLAASVDNAKLSSIEVLPLSSPPPVASEPSTSINAGGSQYTDTTGQVWSADQSFDMGGIYSTTAAISGTNNPTLYQSERYLQSFSYQIPVPTNGTYQVNLGFAEIYWNGPGLRVFDVLAEGQLAIDDLDIWSEVGANTALNKTINVPVTDGILNLDFKASVENAKVSSIQVLPTTVEHTGHPFLHVVIDAPSRAVDYEGNGSEAIFLRGDESHTHELGRTLNSFIWKDGNTVLGTTVDLQTTLGLGNHAISLTIGDDGVPTETLTDTVAVNVFPINAVGGVLTQYYPGASLNNLPASPSFMEIVPTLNLVETNGKIGSSPILENTAVVMSGKFTATTGGTYTFTTNGGSSSQIYLNGALVNGPINLASQTTYTLEARIARDAAATDPIEVLASINGGLATALSANTLTHDESNLKPFINGLSTPKGSELGGQSIALNGVAFFDGDASNQVKVYWGNQVLTKPSISVEQGVIRLLTPPGTGTVAVKVETPKGMSNPVYFTYETASVPVSFTPEAAIANATPFSPTTAEWGPDGRLYVGAINGEITIYTFDDNYNITNTQKVTSLSSLTNSNILGIAFNPFDTSSSPKIYVSHSQLFANGGGAFTGFSPYSGQVSVLSGPNFSTVTPLITGLPVSNHDHGVNGLAFDNNGNLLIANGGNTNAGIPNPNLGDLPESPLSGAVLKAQLTNPTFNGSIEYINPVTGVENNDQVFGNAVSVAPGVDVSVYGNGFRNPYDIVFTTQGKLFGTDNGPNGGYGAASTSATTQSSDPTNPDELNLVTEGSYYGHPNRNRGQTDARQNVYHGPAESSISGVYTAPLTTFDPSTDGLTEYRSMAFGGQMRGNLLAQKWNGQLYRTTLTADQNGVQTLNQLFGNTSGLDILTGPGGALLGIDYSDNAITLSTPIDSSVVGATAYDIFPWRAPAIGGNSFTIGGKNFGNLSDTIVKIGGQTAVLTSVSPTRIKGIIPSQAATGQLLDVSITSAGKNSLLPSAFLYLADGSTPQPSNPGTLSFSSPSFTVNEDGTPGAVVTVTRTGGNSGVVSTTITPTNGTATAPEDYNSSPITVTFAAGDTTAKTIPIPIVNDTIAEPSETINLLLTNPTGGAILGSQQTATLTIVDNDTVAPTRIEAESMSLNTYRVEALGSASGGQAISLLGGNALESGTASFNFSGPTGTYDVVLGYYDENDGVAHLAVKMGNTLLNSWDLNQQLGSNLATAQTLTRKVVTTGLTVTQGTLFTISGTETDLEHARVDYIEFVPVTPSGSDTQSPTASFSGSNLTTGGGTGHTFTVTYTDDSAIDVADLDNNDIRVTGPNGFNQLATLVSINLASNGSPRIATYRINAPGGSWDGADNGTYTVAMEANQVSDTSNKWVGSGNLGSFTVNITSMNAVPLRVEAETATLDIYRTEANTDASGGTIVSLLYGPNPEIGRAAFTFSGTAGSYNIVVGYYDDNDGAAQLEATLGNTVLDTWTLNQNLGSDLPNAQTRMRRTIATNLSLSPGSVITLKGTENQGDAARIDYVDFIPVTSTTSAPFTTPGVWDRGPVLPQSLGEVAAGVINGVLYVVGESSNATLAYDIAAGTWRSNVAPRPLVGNHHAAEVFNGKLYLLGGLGSGAGKVQIYDPIANSWQIGADMPFAVGSSSSAVINNEIYVAGGIVGSSTTNQVAKYNPVTNSWTLLASMPQGRNHAASATDGQKLYVFGGRGPGSGDANVVANGFNTVQIYSPTTNTWVSSLDAGSTLASLPQARGGMGKAVYLNGEFYVIGGETSSGTGATAQNVYNRVDIYNPTTNTWRSGTTMPTARHGIFPVLYAGEIWVAGGGQLAGFSSSDILEIL